MRFRRTRDTHSDGHDRWKVRQPESPVFVGRWRGPSLNPARHHEMSGPTPSLPTAAAGDPRAAIVEISQKAAPPRQPRRHVEAARAVPDWISGPDGPTSMSRRDEPRHRLRRVHVVIMSRPRLSRRIEAVVGARWLPTAKWARKAIGYSLRNGSVTEESVRPWCDRPAVDAVDGASPNPGSKPLVHCR